MSKELTHIGMVQRWGRYSDNEDGEPFAVRLRGTKTRWCAGTSSYGDWWPTAEKHGACEKVDLGSRNYSAFVKRLDLSTVREMTTEELRGPLASAVAHGREMLANAKQVVVEAELVLAGVTEPLKAFDKKHGWTGYAP